MSMKIVWISNVLNHHTSEITDELFRIYGSDFIFISICKPDSFEYTKGGDYREFLKKNYHLKYYESKTIRDYCNSLVEEADVLIQQAAGDCFIRKRLRSNKLTLRISEHIFKDEKHNTLRRIKYILRNFPFRKKTNFLFLGASAYAANDMEKCFSFKNRTYKWGYFPKVSFSELMYKKINKKMELLWVGRFVSWKHPETCIKIAEFLISKQQPFHIKMIGNGPEQKRIKRIIEQKNLNNFFTLIGEVSSNDVQEYMRYSDYYIFSSDHNEGWGAVLNESMANGCIPIASIEAGSSPYLIKDRVNGFIYDHKNYQTLYNCLEEILALDLISINKMRTEAHFTIVNEWSPKIATKNLIQLISAYQKSDMSLIPFNGPASYAQPVQKYTNI